MSWMTLAEGLLIGFLGGGLGILAAYIFLTTGHFAISSEGLSIVFKIHQVTIMKATLLAITIGLISGVYPALHSLRGNLVDKLRNA